VRALAFAQNPTCPMRCDRAKAMVMVTDGNGNEGTDPSAEQRRFEQNVLTSDAMKRALEREEKIARTPLPALAVPSMTFHYYSGSRPRSSSATATAGRTSSNSDGRGLDAAGGGVVAALVSPRNRATAPGTLSSSQTSRPPPITYSDDSFSPRQKPTTVATTQTPFDSFDSSFACGFPAGASSNSNCTRSPQKSQ
jgi:hypothetical protein